MSYWIDDYDFARQPRPLDEEELEELCKMREAAEALDVKLRKESAPA